MGQAGVEPINTIVARKPFHEVMIEMIQQASKQELITIGMLLIKTKIPKGHDEIVAVWRRRCDEMEWSLDSTLYVADDVLLHKRQIEAEKQADADSTAQYLLDS
jgi:hypothetical protein